MFEDTKKRHIQVLVTDKIKSNNRLLNQKQ